MSDTTAISRQDNPDHKDWVYLDFEWAAQAPAGTLTRIVDCWWCVHPQKGMLFFRGHASPQCNKNESIARRLVPDFCDVRFMPSVFVPLKISDYIDR